MLANVSVEVPSGDRIATSASNVVCFAEQTLSIIASHYEASDKMRSFGGWHDWSQSGVLTGVTIEKPSSGSGAASASGIESPTEKAVGIRAGNHEAGGGIGAFCTGKDGCYCGMFTYCSI